MIQVAVVAGLAGTRLTRAWLHESIGEPLRRPIEDWADDIAFDVVSDDPPHDAVITVTEPPVQLAVKTAVGELVTCPHCIGFWFTLGCVIAYRWRITRPFVVALAGATIVSAFADHYPGFAPEEPADG